MHHHCTTIRSTSLLKDDAWMIETEKDDFSNVFHSGQSDKVKIQTRKSSKRDSSVKNRFVVSVVSFRVFLCRFVSFCVFLCRFVSFCVISRLFVFIYVVLCRFVSFLVKCQSQIWKKTSKTKIKCLLRFIIVFKVF